MTSGAKSLAVLRIAMGWLMLYAGATKIADPRWSAEGYLRGAKTFAGFYGWLTSPGILPVVNFVNEWGLTLLGISLIVGAFVRLSSLLGAALMFLYWFPVLTFPYVAPHSYIVDDHVIYGLVLIYFAAVRAGRTFGIENWCQSLPICRQFPRLRQWLG